MQKKELSKRSSVYIFDEIDNFMTYVYVIRTPNYTFIIDTFCGPPYMNDIISDLGEISHHNTFIINTHFHWDHIWGNCCFDKFKIIAHESCNNLIMNNWDEMMHENETYAKGNIKMVLPNMLINKSYDFIDDEIHIFHSPGHTSDGISVFDKHDQFLYVGDNLERPNVFVESDDISTYIKTLNHYKSFKAKKYFAGHTLDLDDNDLKETIKYLQNLK